MFTRIDIKKPRGGGAPQGKSPDVVVIALDEVAYWPNRDSKGVVMQGEIVMQDGKYATMLEATASSISLPVTSEGEEDAVSFTSLPEFYHPGSSLEFEEFVVNMTNRPLALGFRIGACDGEQPYYKFYGTKCTPLSLLVEGQNNNEATKNMIKFQQFQRSKTTPGRYYGTITLATVNVIPADAAVIDVSPGSGRYQLTDNSGATLIDTIVNASQGVTYTLVGSGGVNPAIIESSNSNFLLKDGTDWQGLAGTTITFETFPQALGGFVFIERHRV